jgi:hypothetical protein
MRSALHLAFFVASPNAMLPRVREVVYSIPHYPSLEVFALHLHCILQVHIGGIT